ncbi:MAG: hypothetical protein ACRDA4_08065 [Filifactoraceae bacterium]
MSGIFDFNNEGRKKLEGIHSMVEWNMADFHREGVPVSVIEQHIKRRLIQGIADLIDKEFDKLPLEISTRVDNDRGTYQFKLDMLLISQDEYRRLYWKDKMFKTPEEDYESLGFQKWDESKFKFNYRLKLISDRHPIDTKEEDKEWEDVSKGYSFVYAKKLGNDFEVFSVPYFKKYVLRKDD